MKTINQLTPAELEQLANLRRRIIAIRESAETNNESWFVECASNNNVIRVSVDPRDVAKISAMLTDRLENEVDKILGYV